MKYADYNDIRILGYMGVFIYDPRKMVWTVNNDTWRRLGFDRLACQTARKHYRFRKSRVKYDDEDSKK